MTSVDIVLWAAAALIITLTICIIAVIAMGAIVAWEGRSRS